MVMKVLVEGSNYRVGGFVNRVGVQLAEKTYKGRTTSHPRPRSFTILHKRKFKSESRVAGD